MSSTTKTNPVVIKKYANRRLYNTETSAYVTLDDLCQMIKKGEEIIVFDAKNGDDITRSVLTQIIVEQESKEGQNLLPTAFLRQIISMYGNGAQQGMLPKYLEVAMQSFTKNQSQMQDYFRTAFGGIFPMNAPMNMFEEMSKQNMAMMEKAMRMFAPMAGAGGETPDAAKPEETSSKNETPQEEAAEDEPAASAASAPPAQRPVLAVSNDEPEDEDYEEEVAQEDDPAIRDMQKRLTDLQKQIANMGKE